MTIRPERDEDFLAIREVLVQAFGRDEEANLVEALRREGNYLAELALVGLVDDQIVAHIFYSPVTVDSSQAIALAPLAVAPVHQNRGFGSALMCYSMDQCAKLGKEPVIVLGHPEFYQRAGFVPASRFGVRAPFDVPDEAFLIWASATEKLHGITGTVKYAKPFEAV